MPLKIALSAIALLFGLVAAPTGAVSFEPAARLAQGEVAGIYEGEVHREFIQGRRQRETRLYRVAINPDGANAAIWIYQDGKLLYTLLATGRMEGRTFVGRTRPVQQEGDYNPDRIRLEFAADGGTLTWFHTDGNTEGRGTLTKR